MLGKSGNGGKVQVVETTKSGGRPDMLLAFGS